MKKWLAILMVCSVTSAYGAFTSGTATPEGTEVHVVKFIEHTKNIDVPVYQDKVFEVPQIKFIPTEVKDVTVVTETVNVKNVTVEEVTKVVEVPQIKYIEQIVSVPVLDKDAIIAEINKVVEAAVQTAISGVNIEKLIKKAIDAATENVKIKNALIENVPVTNAVIKNVEVIVEVPKYVDKEVMNPVLRERVIRVNKVILADGSEL